jgi:prevent-host-death family protein
MYNRCDSYKNELLYIIESMVRRLTISEARKDFADTLRRAHYGNEVTVVTSRGKDVAAVVPMDHLPPEDSRPPKEGTSAGKITLGVGRAADLTPKNRHKRSKG